MSQQAEAEEYGRCVRCGRYSGPEVLCARCDAAQDRQDREGTMDEQRISQNQADARRLGLPRIVWEAMPYRVVECYSDDDDRIYLTLERWEGSDRLGADRWVDVPAPNPYDAEGAQHDADHWAAAFWALATPLFVPDEEAERRRAEDERRRRRLDEMRLYDPRSEW